MSLPLVLAVWLVLGLIVASVYGYFGTKQSQLERDVTRLQQLHKQQSEILTSLTTELNTRVTDPKLFVEIDNRQQILSLKQRVHAELVGKERGEQTGFAKLMIDFATYHHKDIWLKRIYFNEDHVVIEGGASLSASIPQWLNTLNKSQAFQGLAFSKTHIHRDNNQQFHFVLAANEQSAEQGGVK